MNPVKIVKVGGNLLIIGSDKAEVEAASRAASEKGVRLLSKVELMGRNWAVTCEDPDEQAKQCHIVKVGLQAMIKGPTQQAVKEKVDELIREGAKLLSAPSEATGGGWVAVCDESEQLHRW
jgi:hypothetical protein